jgi:hypothetical protein
VKLAAQAAGGAKVVGVIGAGIIAIGLLDKLNQK